MQDKELPHRISVIIPVFNSAHTIGRALESVLAQTIPVVEIIVVDDGSSDNLASAIHAYRERVQVIRKTNGGAASARNLGIERSTGDYVAFLDADDYWEPCKLAVQLDCFRQHPEAGTVASQFYTCWPEFSGQLGVGRGESDAWLRQLALGCRADLLDRVLRLSGEPAFCLATKVWTGTVIVRRSVLGDHRFVPGLRTGEDRDLWLRLILAAPIYISSKALATAVLEPNSLSRSSVDIDCHNMLLVVHRHRGLLGRCGLRKWESYVYRRWAAGHLGKCHPRAAVRPACLRLVRQPFSAEAWWIAGKSLALSLTGSSVK